MCGVVGQDGAGSNSVERGRVRPWVEPGRTECEVACRCGVDRFSLKLKTPKRVVTKLFQINYFFKFIY